jgi:SWI/SNF-related matrix-associated actin-dependent regulator of chromatin subfamily B protein 1
MAPPTWIPATGPVRPPFPAPSDTPAALKLPVKPVIPVKEWEEHLNLDIPVTEITPLPAETDDPTFGGVLPILSEDEQKEIKQFMEKDLRYTKDVDKLKEGAKRRMIEWAKGNDMDTPWWDLRKGERPRPPAGRLTIVWPGDKVVHRSKTSHKGRREIRL